MCYVFDKKINKNSGITLKIKIILEVTKYYTNAIIVHQKQYIKISKFEGGYFFSHNMNI